MVEVIGLCSNPSWPADLGYAAGKAELERIPAADRLIVRSATEAMGLSSNPTPAVPSATIQ
jgi:hypothetical protein